MDTYKPYLLGHRAMALHPALDDCRLQAVFVPNVSAKGPSGEPNENTRTFCDTIRARLALSYRAKKLDQEVREWGAEFQKSQLEVAIAED
jgi:hypothetical protein